MNAVKAWVLSVAVSSAVAGIIYILTPKGSTQKIVRLAIFTFVICSSLSPLLSGSINLDFDLPEVAYSSDKEERLVNKISESMEAVAVKCMQNILTSMKIKDARIKISTDKNDDLSIVITDIVITVPTEYISLSQEIKIRIKNELGYDVRVKV